MKKKDIKTRNICFAMTEKDYEKVCKKADKADMSLSAYIRHCIRIKSDDKNS